MIRFINVPFNSAGFSTGVARMPAALGFTGVDLRVAALPVRGPFGLLAEDALVQMVADVESAVRECHLAGETPVLIGGDCPIMLGALAAMDDPGLVFIDGHEDAWQPTPDVRGEASDSELGIAVGTVAAPVPPVVDPTRVLALGPRDSGEILARAQQQIGQLVTLRDDVWVSAATAADLRALAGPATASDWWLHVDLDVLSSDALVAVDYPQPGGLSWRTLESTIATLLAMTGCRGASIVVYNPDLDSGSAAPRVAAFVSHVAELLDLTP